MDLKQNPLYESEGFTLADTHYYGGIKKIPMGNNSFIFYGVVCKKKMEQLLMLSLVKMKMISCRNQ